MKISSIFSPSAFLLLTFGFSQIATAQKSDLEPIPKLQKITVFTDRAMISKETVVSVKRGENIVRILGITPNLIDQSVQVGLTGQTELSISEVAVEETFLRKTDQPEITKLQSSLLDLNNQINEESNRISVINSGNDFLRKVNPFPQNLKVTTAEMEAHSKFLEKSLSANFERMATIETKIKKLTEDKTSIENELANLKSGKNRSKTIVIHLLSLIDKSNVKLGFSYLSTEAGWAPQYEAKGDINESKVAFNYFATIRQSTGEDWTEANIEISTAKPFIYGNIPELSAWYIDVFTPRFVRSRSLISMDKQAAPQVMMAQAAAPAAETQFEETAIEEGNTSFTFVLPRKVNIASDGQPHKVSIIKSDIDAKYSWFTSPKLVQNAFLKATMKNPYSFPLLTGPVSVFLDQKLVGTATIESPVLADGDLELSLGVDEGIKIERKLIKKFTDYAGLLTRETTVSFEYGIEITNGKSKEVNLELNDQFPVSRNEKINVERLVPRGGEAAINEEGKITWKVTLAPAEKKIVPLKFNISYPKDLNVSGL